MSQSIAVALVHGPAPTPPSPLIEEDLSAAAEFLIAEKAAATQAAYRSDFLIFTATAPPEAWRPCQRRRRASWGSCPPRHGRRQSINSRAPRGRDPLCPQAGRA